ncbi:TonB-dependent siderophore receptor [soil metagenome]
MTVRHKARAAAPAFLALSCIGSIAGGSAAMAQEDQRKLGGMTVTDTAIDEDAVKVEKVQSPKYVRDLLDTPQTITVIGSQTIKKQNLLTLRDVLSTVPGITFGAGEGGGGYGDSINLRGFSANSDITVDGVRDSAQYTRSDTFNLEQIEVFNGANGAVAGSGSVGGTINLATKLPKADDLTILNAGVGTDGYYRATVDANKRISDFVAVRLNGMIHRNDVPDRDYEKFKRWGIAPSITLGIDSPTRLTFAYLHQEDNNIPQYGVPYFAQAGGMPDGFDRKGYYGLRGVDTQKINVDSFTAIFDHDFSDTVSIRNLARWQDVQQTSIATAPQGTFCLASTGLTPTGTACRTTITAATAASATAFASPATVAITVPAGSYLLTGPQGNVRDTRNQLAYDQVDLKATLNTGGLEHAIVLGASAAWEKFELNGGSVLRNADGTNPYDRTTTARHLPFGNIADPSSANIYNGPYNLIPTSYQVGEQTNYAVYLFDAIKVADWLEFNGGLRYEKNKGHNRTDAIAAFTSGTVTKGDRKVGTVFESDETLFSYRGGVVVKPAKNASIYAAYGNSKTPSKSSVNGACTAATCTVAPEGAVNYEFGAKYDAIGGRLQLTAALFRNERTNYKVTSNDPQLPDLQVLDGRSRVDGIALGATGNVTSNWTVFANYTYLKSKVLQNISNYCLANPGAVSGTLTCPMTDVTKGDPLTNTPKHSGSLFTTYQLPFGLQVGYGFTYQGSFLLNNGADPLYKSNDYLTHRAFLSYAFNNGLTAQLNVQNFTNEKYFTRIRNNGWATPGDARSAVLSLAYSF